MDTGLDPIQIIIVVVAVVAGFIQWLWKLLQEQRQSQQLPREEDPAIKRLREEAWRHQTAEASNKPPAPPPVRPPPPPRREAEIDPWSTVRDVFEQLKQQADEARRTVQPPLPPTLPTPPVKLPRPHTVRATLPPPQPPAIIAVQPTPAAPPPPRAILQRMGPDMGLLRSLLATPASLRQAVLLREVLGPPKALQSSGDTSF